MPPRLPSLPSLSGRRPSLPKAPDLSSLRRLRVSPDRDDALDASLAMFAAGLHLAMASVVDRFPPELDPSLLFVVLPAVGAAVAAVALLLGERRPLLAACVFVWLVALFTLPAGLGHVWIPGALVLTVAVLRPRLSTARSAAG